MELSCICFLISRSMGVWRLLYNLDGSIFIYVCREQVDIPASKPYISFIGRTNRAREVVITWHAKASDLDSSGVPLGTDRTPTVTVHSDYFCATGITIQVPLDICIYIIAS